MNAYYEVKQLESLTFHIGFPVVQTAGHLVVVTNISWMDRLPSFLRYGALLVSALRAHGALLRYKKLI